MVEKQDENLKKKLEECLRQKDEYLAGWQRARADFLNYKKEEMERITALLAYAGEELVLKILPILDNFELAEKKIAKDLKGEEDKSSSPPFAAAREKDENVKGILQIKNQILDFLKNQGVEEMKTVGEKFDPNLHEAIETKEGGQSGVILEEVQRGYIINGRLLRPAKVKVAR
ncbi:MAG: nucleotide exchange factor GrpE [Candidatus Pacebacteria bacterium]|nr:nucleotide exchange factor GrpE [Candidatus Paceibacterota bacterium]